MRTVAEAVFQGEELPFDYPGPNKWSALETYMQVTSYRLYLRN